MRPILRYACDLLWLAFLIPAYVILVGRVGS